MRHAMTAGAAALVAMAGAALAQPMGAPPAETASGTFVDAGGCAWQRVEIGGRADWAALQGADGAQICTLTPSPAAVVEMPRRAQPQPQRPDFPADGYYLQLGAYRDDVNAGRAVAFLQGQGHGALRSTGAGRMPLQIIYGGPFTSRDAALAARRAARAHGYADAFLWEPRRP